MPSRRRLLWSGKVRDMYDAGEHLLMVASDRISAFDVVIPTPIPWKGTTLTQLSTFWFERLAEVVPNHLTDLVPSSLGLVPGITDLDERAVVVRRADRIDVECVVRGYLAGSAWSAYRCDGSLHGHQLPSGLGKADKLPEPIFTPSTKAESGHDERMTRSELADLVGGDVADELERRSLALFKAASAHAADRGLILADTKFEFGWVAGELTLIDEALTPDSSRYWDALSYEVGTKPVSYDKQPVRDWLEATGWDKEPPAPELPDEVVASTSARYRDAFSRLTGATIDEWLASRVG